jgi:BirA family biotin operon repressor/biotin-[acetyl-CoA-carboxylase] ligase
MASVLVRSDGAVQQLSFVAALALRAALVGVDPLLAARLRLKWPNDVLLDGTKFAGILLERAGDGLVIGFGVNIARHPADTERPATSLAAAGVQTPSPRALLDMLRAAFAAFRAQWADAGFEPIRREWLAHAAGLGDRMAARLGSESIEGRFEGLAPDGALALRLDDGTMRPVHAGEVFAL